MRNAGEAEESAIPTSAPGTAASEKEKASPLQVVPPSPDAQQGTSLRILEVPAEPVKTISSPSKSQPDHHGAGAGRNGEVCGTAVPSFCGQD